MGLKAIGGYFELENRFESEYHIGMIRLNTGRNCLEYILRARGYKKAFLPEFSCSSLLEPIHKLKLDFEYYPINENFEIASDLLIADDECIVLINYFGLKGEYIRTACETYNNPIVDNTQAFFELPYSNSDTFYSARKFFGVPDGAYLNTNLHLEEEIEQEKSWERCEHLIRRIDHGAGEGYTAYLKNEKYLSKREIQLMSEFSYRILTGINYQWVQTRRNQNFQYLHLKLRSFNELNLSDADIDGPMAYPLYINKTGIREELIRNKIYIGTYWPEVLETVDKSKWEYQLAEKLLVLPVDQRYGLLDMDRICKVISSMM